MKIGDLWVKLGLKKDEFDRGMKEAGNQVSGSGGLLGKIKGLKVGALAAWTAIAAGAVAMADKFAHTSQRLGDKWDQVTSGLKASWNSFMAAVNSADFSHIGQRLMDAFKGGSELASMKDAEFEVMNSIELQKAMMKDELAILHVRMQNQKLSQKERQKAAEDYLAKVKSIYDQEAQYRRDYANMQKETYLANAGVALSYKNQNQLEYFLMHVAPKSNLVQALDQFKKNNFTFSDEAQRKLLEELKTQSGYNLRTLSQIANYYQSTNDATARELVNAIVAAKKAEGAFNEETRRIQNVANNVVSRGGGGSTDADPLMIPLLRALDKMDDVAQEYIEDLEDEISKDNESIEFEPLEIVPPDMTEWDEFYNKFKNDQKRMQDLLKEFRDATIEGFSDAVQELTDQIMGLEDVNPGKIVQALLTPLADMAIKEGEILIAQGIGIEACKEALDTLQGAAAIAAGATLLAIGAAAKSGLKALASTGGRTTSSTTYTGATSGNMQNIQTELTVNVRGTIRGSDIVLSGQKTINNWNR